VSRGLAPPSGGLPPRSRRCRRPAANSTCALAAESCRAYDAEFPDERERYGPAGLAWCIHDSQHLLNWAALSLAGSLPFEQQLAWLARILEARDFPLERLARSLELHAATVLRAHPDERQLSKRLRHGAAYIRSQPTFLW
jgi:hypothetical protein